MSSILPAAYSFVLFFTGTIFGIFVWYWFRGTDDGSATDFKQQTRLLRESIRLEQERVKSVEAELRERMEQLRCLDQHNLELGKRIEQATHSQQSQSSELKSATRRIDLTLELLQEEKAKAQLATTERKTLLHQIDSLNLEIAALRTESEHRADNQGEEDLSNEPITLRLFTADSNAEPVSAVAKVIDPVRGLIYLERPPHVDDLKQIAGIADVLESKLHKEGIYQFEQIMNWNDEAIIEFSQRLRTFRDRIQRNNWVGQARFFHEQQRGAAEAV
jgi:predicted flap endonuclease-1-like 5' DNA nuclease